MVHLILTGATGLVGSACLTHILALPPSNAITRLSILSRSAVPLLTTHPHRTNTTTEIEVINHTDYNTYPAEVLAKLKGATGVLWAQGISQSEASKADYVKITYDYPVAAARAFAQLAGRTDGDGAGSGKLNFVYVSGEGATHRPGRFTQLFARVKGQAELALMGLTKEKWCEGKLNMVMARPGGVDGSNQPEIWGPVMQRRGWLLRAGMKPMLVVIGATYPNMMIPTENLGRVLVELAMGEGEVRGKGVEEFGEGSVVVSNIGLRRLGGLPV